MKNGVRLAILRFCCLRIRSGSLSSVKRHDYLPFG